MQQGTELAVIVLQRRKTFEVSDTAIKGLWRVMLQYPHKNLFKPLLASTGEKEFYELLKLLHEETVYIYLLIIVYIFVVLSQHFYTDQIKSFKLN